MRHPPSTGPLSGLTIIDLATMMAAPWAATFLADYGANVIKVERPGTGDDARRFGLSKDGEPVFWKSLGRNKRSIVIDLKSKAGKEIFTRLVRSADAVTENFRPGVLERLGLDYPSLAEINKRIILLSVTGFGQDGPYRNRAGFGTLLEAMSGFAYSNGHPDGPPTLPALPLADGVAGAFGALAVMIALYERDHGSGRGQHIDLSLYEPLARLLEGHILDYSVLGVVRQRLGNRSLSSAPRNAFETRDGKWVALSASSQAVFERLMTRIGEEELIHDPRFLTNHDRIEHSEELDEVLGRWIGRRTRDDVVQSLTEAGAAIGPIYDIAEYLQDPHVIARNSYEKHSDPVLGDVTIPSVVARLSRTPGSVRHLGEGLAASTEAILEELGCSPKEIADLREEGAVE